MTQTKKIVHASQYALDKDIERLKADGWEVVNKGIVPRGAATKRLTYIANLKRVK